VAQRFQACNQEHLLPSKPQVKVGCQNSWHAKFCLWAKISGLHISGFRV
jgi:hypothetical protein